jgi:alanine dehydrogenase
MNKLKVGVIGTSRKENEQRYPIHPAHLSRIPKELRKQLIFEEGYGIPFGITDDKIAAQTGGIASRHDLLTKIGTVIINKPVLADLEELRVGGTLWGYVHCVQQRDITQIALERKQTLIAFEDMFAWSTHGKGRHTFYKNNEMAGYCAVKHALQLKGIDGHYGNQRKTLIFGFGAVSRGAVYALQAHGYRDITICVQRPDHEVREEILDCHYVNIKKGKTPEEPMTIVEHDGSIKLLTQLIKQSDIIVNGVLQDTHNPTHFVTQKDNSCLKPNSLIIDVSCDEGMGFFFAKPTTFEKPMFKHETVDYYAVDHTPSYLWESATRSISGALIVYLSTVLAGRNSWEENETIRKAINIDEGVIRNSDILSFQNRDSEYPHEYIKTNTNTNKVIK